MRLDVAIDSFQPNCMNIFSYFFMTTYVVGTHLKDLLEALLMSTHNICFCGEIRKVSFCVLLLLGTILDIYCMYFQMANMMGHLKESDILNGE